ncbi:hypothetical protein [Microbacterium sp. Leaf320]|uniref:hypothetical protein n=1 Tax=Microbacterium sp. Leaf320 TaxID=1736334 RepID=UPI0006F298F5|nr:hypothetical protein [Microbacterium sp. Leaf320]KQQ66102.1 hypothetical protein ASF63_12330 [Microbacterium sp. Leaf320]
MSTPNPFGIQQSPASIKLAKEIVRIASNTEFEDLRTEMIESLIMREVHGRRDRDGREVAVGALAMVALTVEVLADDIARTAPLVTIATELVKRPDFDSWRQRIQEADEAESPRPLRRLAAVDEQLRSLEP